MTRTVLGTPHFMAPEAVGKGTVDHRSDLYSVGCTLYRLLTQDTVFAGSTVKEILLAHRDEEPPTLRASGVDAPRELDELLAGLLAGLLECVLFTASAVMSRSIFRSFFRSLPPWPARRSARPHRRTRRARIGGGSHGRQQSSCQIV